MGDERPLVRLRLERGCRCLVVRIGDGIAAYGWLSMGSEWIGELGLEIRPAPGEAYLWNCVTLPEHRYRGYYRALLLQAFGTGSTEALSDLGVIVPGFAAAKHYESGRTLVVVRLRSHPDG